MAKKIALLLLTIPAMWLPTGTGQAVVPVPSPNAICHIAPLIPVCRWFL